MSDGLDLTFTVILALLAGAVIGVELWAVARRRRGDTISEHAWWLFDRLPWLRVVYVVFVVWLTLHLLWHWP